MLQRFANGYVGKQQYPGAGEFQNEVNKTTSSGRIAERETGQLSN